MNGGTGSSSDWNLSGEMNLLQTPALDMPEARRPKMDDWTRTALALLLVALLIFVIVTTTITVVAKPDHEATVEAYLKIVLSPIIGVVGSVVGFYFGARTAGSGT